MTTPAQEELVRTRLWRPWRLLALVAIYVVIAHVLPRPDGVSAQGWRITAVFASAIAGFLLQPVPAAVVVLAALVALAILGGVPMPRVLSGYGSPTVWLVGIAMLMSRPVKDTGLARRIALLFVRRFGGTSLGVAYSLTFSEIILAAGIPSITARSGGIMLPIARGITDLYHSKPGPTAGLLGTFLMMSLFQSSAVACAMFITGQASNVLIARLAQQQTGTPVTAFSWFLSALVPGLACAFLIPWLIHRVARPGIVKTPAASAHAREQLIVMGPVRGKEAVTLAVFSSVALLWLSSAWHGLDVTLVALAGLAVLLLSGVYDWRAALQESGAWDTFIWYGGILTLSELLNETGTPKAFAAWVGANLSNIPWFAALVLTMMLFYYLHYGFASVSAHLLALFLPFLAMLTALGVPPRMAVYGLACMANLSAGLTHYGTTTAPMVFAENYVTLAQWWRIGFYASFVNLGVWLTIGLAWWKLLGYW